MVDLSEKTIDELDLTEEEEAIRKLEAALFVSGRWMSIPELITLTDLNPILLKQYIEKLQEKYGEKSGVEIYVRQNNYKMGIRSQYSYLINKLATGNAEFTKAEQETLAIIAYKQPIKQSVIIKIRGNKAYEHIKKFRDLGLINARKEGHTYVLELSDQFYEYFQVNQQKNPDDIKEISEEE